jgi:membrane protease YdiL (CAAX protease family)
LGEEPGWRGFALPRLQQGRSALSAALILGLIWAVWHAPLFTTEEDSRWLPWAIVLPWAIGVVSASILLAWLYNHTNGSTMIPIVMHAANNTVTGGYVWPMFTGADNLRLWWLQAVVWALAAIVVIILAGPARLARLASQQAKIH